MTIHREGSHYCVTCDSCEERLGEGDDGFYDNFQDALDASREFGWRVRRGIGGEWENVCPECP